ncbi:MAG: hypothetical protein L3J25_11615 [Flavobacteriaceae bacterium]|nr:hypothetical protein [Flavobacteriaceae bacterium]
MKSFAFFIIISISLFSCNKKQLDSTFYLNKTNIEIIEFNNNKITRFFLKDSLSENLYPNDIVFLNETKDSLKLVLNDSLIYKKIELNTDGIDLESSEYWTIKLENGQQFWHSFFKFESSDKEGNSYLYDAYYSYYYHPKNKDTSKYNGHNDSRDFKLFNKFRLKDIGPYGGELCLFSRINNDSIRIIPVTSLNNNNEIKTFILEKYNSLETDLYIGNWKLSNSNICDLSSEIVGNELKISSDSVIFYNKEIISNFKYNLGLDSKYLELMFNNKNDDFISRYISNSQIKILTLNEERMKLLIDYPRHDFCKKSDTLIYKRINPEK